MPTFSDSCSVGTRWKRREAVACEVPMVIKDGRAPREERLIIKVCQACWEPSIRPPPQCHEAKRAFVSAH
eukprot:5817910-Amphidinium_carterae.1